MDLLKAQTQPEDVVSAAQVPQEDIQSRSTRPHFNGFTVSVPPDHHELQV